MRLLFMNAGQARTRLVQASSALAAAALLAGCGTNYRPVVTPINSPGPAAQPSSYVAVVSAPSPSTAGIATIIDYSGDTVLAQAPIGPGPSTFTVDQSGTTGYTVNSDGTLSNFPVSANLQAKQVQYTTLSSGIQTGPPLPPVNLFTPSAGLWSADLISGTADLFTGFPQGFKLAIPVANTPVMVVGTGQIGQRNYAISQGAISSGVACNLSPASGPAGTATAIETLSDTVSASIPLGKCPVFAVVSADGRRYFVLNRGDDTISVINSQLNSLDDQCPPPTGCQNQSGQTYFSHPLLPLSTTAVAATGITPPNGTAGMPTTAGPVYAEYNAATAQLVVADYDGGAISLIDVSMDEYGNDSATFGTTYTIAVGQTATPYPASVTALADGSRAYTANQGDCTPDCTTSPNGTVSIVNLVSHTLEKTLPVTGLPRTVVSTQNSQYGKVYVASPNSPYLTILRTDLDIVDTTILVEGNVVDVRVSTQNGTSGNSNNISRTPGYGQPCNLPGANNYATLAACQKQP
jgi:hypothetical protein